MAGAHRHRHRHANGVTHSHAHSHSGISHHRRAAGMSRTRVAPSTRTALRRAASRRPRDRFGRFR